MLSPAVNCLCIAKFRKDTTPNLCRVGTAQHSTACTAQHAQQARACKRRLPGSRRSRKGLRGTSRGECANLTACTGAAACQGCLSPSPEGLCTHHHPVQPRAGSGYKRSPSGHLYYLMSLGRKGFDEMTSGGRPLCFWAECKICGKPRHSPHSSACLFRRALLMLDMQPASATMLRPIVCKVFLTDRQDVTKDELQGPHCNNQMTL